MPERSRGRKSSVLATGKLGPMATRFVPAAEIHPNSVDHIKCRTTTIRPETIWGMLFLRSTLAVVLQCLFAAGFWLADQVDPWRQAADWWLVWLALGEFVNLWLLSRLAA